MKDYLVRATACHDAIRAFGCNSTGIVEMERSIHHYSPIATAALGRLLSAGLLMGDMLKNPTDELTLQIQCEGPIGYLVVTADSLGHVRGTLKNGDVVLPPEPNGHLNVGGALGKGTLTVLEDLGMKEPYLSEIELHSGEIADDLTYYFAQSEQTPTSVGLGVLFDKTTGQVSQAGGYLVQLMPFADSEVIDQLEANIKAIHRVTDLLRVSPKPEDLLAQVLKGFDISFNGTKDVSFQCSCSQAKGARILRQLGTEELDALIAKGQPVEITCDFCGKHYVYPLDDVKAIRESLKKNN
ncbi:MAG: Hsp33 family molecular chaperone HslO [Bacilli bacterium]|jgi:molecular chaperone Hsp33|nr:Hsp33 family molecular chaperone HslO [Bacilli bacterium]